MAEDELFDLSLANFQSMADRMSSEYGRFSERILLISLGVSVGILLMCATVLFRVNICSAFTRGGFGGERRRTKRTVGTDDDSLKFLRSV